MACNRRADPDERKGIWVNLRSSEGTIQSSLLDGRFLTARAQSRDFASDPLRPVADIPLRATRARSKLGTEKGIAWSISTLPNCRNHKEWATPMFGTITDRRLEVLHEIAEWMTANDRITQTEADYMNTRAANTGSWPRWETPASAGWQENSLSEARAYSNTLDTTAVMIIAGGRVVDAWGQVDVRSNARSIRKSFLSALGIREAEGRVGIRRVRILSFFP